MTKPKVVIAGAGPAGMMLAYQLVSNGVPVTVLEQHQDFEREFRGELLGPSVLPALERFGILRELVKRGLARSGVERRMFVGASRRVNLPTGTELGALVSQPGLLGLLHEACSRHGHYEMRFGSPVVGVVREGERVVGFETKGGPVLGDVCVATNGRGSIVRKHAAATLELEEKPDSTLWLRFDLTGSEEALPEHVQVHMFGGGVVVVLFRTTRSRLQIAYSAPGDVAALRKDPAGLRAALLPRLSEPLRGLVDQRIGGDFESQVLRVSIDRLTRWHVPGLLFLGDAAHTMGPAGAQGLNLAIRDAFVAANHVLDAVDAGAPVGDDVFAAIEAERRPEITAAQAGQLRAYGMVQKPLLAQHLMFTMLGLVMRFKSFPAIEGPSVEPRRVVRI
jgi:2-polyprenyl-6-methoxyphenol hydroxylase-like FAD-dependent oxidoreductase